MKLRTTTQTQYFFSGLDMQRIREEMGYPTQEVFAIDCGWTQQHQSQLELPGIQHEVTDFIRMGLEKVGVEI